MYTYNSQVGINIVFGFTIEFRYLNKRCWTNGFLCPSCPPPGHHPQFGKIATSKQKRSNDKFIDKNGFTEAKVLGEKAKIGEVKAAGDENAEMAGTAGK